MPPPAPEPVAEPEPAPAPAFPWRITDHLFSRYELRRNYDHVGKANHPRFTNMDAMFYRARLGVHLEPVAFGDGMAATATVEPQASGVQGNAGALSDPAVGLHQGFLRFGSPEYALRAGRFEMTYGEHLVIGNVGWHQTGQAFDGLRLETKPSGPDSFGLDVFATFVEEGFPDEKEPFGAGDTYFMGAYFMDGGILPMDLDVYLLWKAVPSTDADVEDPMDPTMTGVVETAAAIQMTLGARLKGEAGIADYRLEAGYEAGARPTPPVFGTTNENVSVSAYQADLELGVKLVDKKLRLALEGLVASGDDPDTEDNEAWDQLYPTGHKWIGLSDVYGARSNVAGGVGHVAFKATDALSLNLDVHLYSKMEKGMAESGYMGAEIDTGIGYGIGGGVAARAMYALVLPNEDHWGPGNGKAVHFLEIELSHAMK